VHLETARLAASVLVQGMHTVEREMCDQWRCASVTVGDKRFVRLSSHPSIQQSIHPSIHWFIRPFKQRCPPGPGLLALSNLKNPTTDTDWRSEQQLDVFVTIQTDSSGLILCRVWCGATSWWF